METQAHELYGTTARETDNKKSGKELLEQLEVKNTPFKLVGSENTGYFLALGQYRLTEKMTIEEGAVMEQALQNTDWELMIAIIGAITQQTINVNKGGE